MGGTAACEVMSKPIGGATLVTLDTCAPTDEGRTALQEASHPQWDMTTGIGMEVTCGVCLFKVRRVVSSNI